MDSWYAFSRVEIVSGLSDGDTVYVEAKEEETTGGILSLFGGMQRNQFNPERSNRGNWQGGNSSRTGNSTGTGTGGTGTRTGGNNGGNFGGGMPGGMPPG